MTEVPPLLVEVVEVVASVSLAMLFSDVIESPSLAAGAFRLCMMMGGGLTLMLAWANYGSTCSTIARWQSLSMRRTTLLFTGGHNNVDDDEMKVKV